MGSYDFKYPDSQEPAFPGNRTSIQEAIGQIIIWFKELDQQLSTTISFLLRRDDSVGQIVTAELSFRAKVNLLGALFKNDRPESNHLQELQDLMGACLQIEAMRNQVVH